MVGVAVAVGVSVTVGVYEGVRLGGANCVGEGSKVFVGGPAVKGGNIVRMPAVTEGNAGFVTVANRVGVGVRSLLGNLHVNAKNPAQ
jgi:hypothetical protein